MSNSPTFESGATNVKRVGEWRNHGSKNPFMSALMHARQTGEAIIRLGKSHVDDAWHLKKCPDGFIELKKYRNVNWH